MAVAVLLGFALFLGKVSQKLNFPSVIGQITAGFLLGPSFFGHFGPNYFEWIFVSFDSEGDLLSLFYYLGLIFLMMNAGLSIPRIDSIKEARTSISLIVGALTIPFCIAFITADSISNDLDPSSSAFKIVIACAASVTSVPVLSGIFIDLGIISRNFARNVLAAAALQDIILWIIFSWAISLQTSLMAQAPMIDYFFTFTTTLLFVLITLIIIPGVLRQLRRKFEVNLLDFESVGYSMLLTLSIVVLANLLNVSIVLGALVAGMAIAKVGGNQVNNVKENILNFSRNFFIPIYFALVGLRIDFSSSINIALVLEMLLLTSVIKISSVALFARGTVGDWKAALDYGVAMNARGGPGIVLASLAFEARIIDSDLFIALVLISLITSVIAGFWLRLRIHYI